MAVSRLLPAAGASLAALSSFAGLLILWWLVCSVFAVRPVILAAPPEVWRALVAMALSGELSRDLMTSARELVGGFAIGTALGILTGIALAQSRSLQGFLEPLVESFRFVVPFSLVPLVVVWFGVSVWGKIFVVAYACFFVVAINTANAVENIDPLLLKAARMLGVSGTRLLVDVVLPAALPRILTGLQLALAYGWVSVIAAEYVGASAGIGYFITNAQSGLETGKVIAGMVVIGTVGSLLSLAMAWLRRLLVRHEESAGW